ncbi:MAG: tyrosine--tRNA ligase, partial [Chloroflexota bacterium]|nr:tyrosine--tRNA ligase [Chloroflexota bacterium]
DVVGQFHMPADADAAQEAIERQFQRRELPADIPDFLIDHTMSVIDFVVASGIVNSKSEARRLTEGGGVYIITEGSKTRVDDPSTLIDPAATPIVQVGKRRFARARQK